MARTDAAKLLKNARERAGYTQKEIGDLIGKKQQSIAAWESAKSMPDADTIFLICDLYNMSPNELYYAYKQEKAPTDELQGLDVDEKRLIGGFRCLDDVERGSVLTIVERLSAARGPELEEDIVQMAAEDIGPALERYLEETDISEARES